MYGIIKGQSKIKSYTVLFEDYDGTVLKTQKVKKGASATAPSDPTRSGYRFDGWDKEFSNIQEDTIVIATYVQLFHVQFKDGIDGTILSDQDVVDGWYAIPPTPKEHEGFTFTNWTTYSANIKHHSQISSVYISDATQVITAELSLNDVIEQVNLLDGTNRIEISLTADATITGMVDLTRANVTINGNGYTVTGASTTSASGGLRIKADGLMLKDITWDTTANKAWAMRVYGNYTIYFDGTVTVKSASGYAGIQATQDLNNNDVIVEFVGISNDAVLNVTGGQSAAAIGSSNTANSKSGRIHLYSGLFNATGSANGSAIGGSARGSSGAVCISGDTSKPLTVNATGGDYGAGIGNGYCYSQTDLSVEDVIIHNATVTATGGKSAAGIGSGKRTYEVDVGEVTETGVDSVLRINNSNISAYTASAVNVLEGTYYKNGSLVGNNQLTMMNSDIKKVKNLTTQTALEDEEPIVDDYVDDLLGDEFDSYITPNYNIVNSLVESEVITFNEEKVIKFYTASEYINGYLCYEMIDEQSGYTVTTPDKITIPENADFVGWSYDENIEEVFAFANYKERQ